MFFFLTVIDLLETEKCNGIIEDDCFHSNQLALFTQLFLDDHKMQVGLSLVKLFYTIMML